MKDFLKKIKKGVGVAGKSWKNLGAPKMFGGKGNWAQKGRYKKDIEKKADKESERIFIKNRPDMAMKDGSFPKVGPNQSNKYDKEAKRTKKQVTKTRLKQAKAKGII